MKCKTCNTNNGRCVDICGRISSPFKNKITFELFICNNCLSKKIDEIKEEGFIIEKINDFAVKENNI